MRDDIRLCEVAGSAEPLVEVAEEREVEVHLPIGGAVEGSNLGPPYSARRLSGAIEQHEDRRHVRLAVLTEYFTPRILGVGQHDRDELCLRVVVADAGRPHGLILRNTGRADEIQRVGTGEPRNEEEENESSQSAAKRKPDAAHSHPTTVLDVSAFPSSFPPHRIPP